MTKSIGVPCLTCGKNLRYDNMTDRFTCVQKNCTSKNIPQYRLMWIADF